MSGLAIFYAEIDFIDPGLVFDEEVTNNEPSAGAVDAPSFAEIVPGTINASTTALPFTLHYGPLGVGSR